MTISESRDTSSLDVYAERSQARRESVKDKDSTTSVRPKTREGHPMRVILFVFEHELHELNELNKRNYDRTGI